MTFPGEVPPKLQRAWDRRDAEQREALEQLVLGKQYGEWDRPAEWLAAVLKASGDSISASTVRSYRRSLDLAKELTR